MKLEAQLSAIYARFPLLTVDADKSKLEAAANKLFGPSEVKQLLQGLLDHDTYLAARQAALQLQPPPAPPAPGAKRVVVAGLSSGGALAAIVAARAGYHVEAYEQRGAYTRYMQFSTRQDAVNELASIDPKLADEFIKRLSPLPGGSVFTDAKGVRHEAHRAALQPGDPTAVPKTGEQMLSGVPISLVECDLMEDLIFEYLEKIPGVSVNTKLAVSITGKDGEGNFTAAATAKDGTTVDLGKPFLIIGATGANTPMREAVGIRQGVASPKQGFIGGLVEKGLGGKMVARRDDYHRADGSTERIITMALGTALLNRTWALVGKRPDANLTPAAGLDPRSPEYKAEQQKLLEAELRKEAALVMETDLTGVALHGPFEGSAVLAFDVEQHMSDKAAAGNNFVAIGDFVGNGHFTVGGGMATATTAHIERLKTLFFDLELGADKQASMTKFSDGAIADSMAWGRRGMPEFYPDVDKQLLEDLWVRSVKEWIAGQHASPLAALERYLKEQSLALAPIGKAAA